MTVQMISQIRYLSGPFPELICQLEYLIKNIMTLWWILLADFVLTVRFIFVFMTKNPTAIQDEFWIVFLAIWSIGFGFICQLSYLIIPGKMPMSFYFCVGKMPKSLAGAKVKNNVSFNFMALMTIISHTYFHIRIFLHKRQVTPTPQQRSSLSQPCQQQSIQRILTNKIKQENLFSLASNAIAISVMVLCSVAPAMLNQTDPELVDLYPNYLWAYLHQHITVNVGILGVCFLYFYKKPGLAKPFTDWLHAAIGR